MRARGVLLIWYEEMDTHDFTVPGFYRERSAY